MEALDQSAWQRGMAASVRAFDNPRSGIWALQAVLAAAVGVPVGNEVAVVSLGLQAVVGAAAGLAVFWGVPVAWSGVAALNAPRLQRNEARQLVTYQHLKLKNDLDAKDRVNKEQEQSWREAFETKSAETERLRGLLGEAETKLKEQPAFPVDDLDAAARRNQADVLRADLVFLSDEVAAARRTILTAHNESVYWNAPMGVDVWLAVKDKHLSAERFHGPRSNVAEAYEAIKEAENLRMVHEVDRKVGTAHLTMHDRDRQKLRKILDRIVEGENSLTRYLDGLDAPAF